MNNQIRWVWLILANRIKRCDDSKPLGKVRNRPAELVCDEELAAPVGTLTRTETCARSCLWWASCPRSDSGGAPPLLSGAARPRVEGSRPGPGGGCFQPEDTHTHVRVTSELPCLHTHTHTYPVSKVRPQRRGVPGVLTDRSFVAHRRRGPLLHLQ